MRRLLASVVESVFHAGDIPQSHSTRFSDDLSASISLDAFTLDSLSGNVPLPRSGMSLNWPEPLNTNGNFNDSMARTPFYAFIVEGSIQREPDGGLTVDVEL